MYSNIVLEHFQNPHNQGTIENPDGVGQVGNPVCGDIMKLYLKIKTDTGSKNTEKNIIQEIKFETLGCGAAIASSSVLTDMVKGKTLAEALKISKAEVVEKLGGLPPAKIHCSLLAVDALRKAIDNYKNK